MTEGVFLPDRVLRQAAQRFGTPFYVYEEAGIRRRVKAAQEAFASCGGLALFFPVRLNPNPAVLNILRESGCGAECVTAEELRLAARCGFSGASVRYAPLIPEPEGEALCAALDAGLVLDDPALRPGFLPRRVWIRIHPCGKLLWSGHAAAQCEKSKFGMAKCEAFLLANYYLAEGVETGFSVRLAENSCEAELWPAALQAMLAWAQELCEGSGYRLRCFDLGPGPGISRRSGLPDADLSAVAALLRKAAGEDEIALSGAPGSWLVGWQGNLVTRAVMVKKRVRPLVILDVDGDAIFTNRAGEQEVRVLGARTDNLRTLALTDVCGCGPTMRDRIAERRVLPPVKAGDLMVLLALGAHAAAGIPELLWGEDGALYRTQEEAPFRVKAW